MIARARTVYGALTRTQSRVSAREKQLVAWAHMLGARTVQRTKAALHVVDALRIAAYALSVLATVREGVPLPLGIAVMIGALVLFSAAHLALRDAILARAFETLTPSVSSISVSSPTVAPRVAPLSSAAQAAVLRAQAPRKPRARPKPAIVLEDREAVDFDDAMSGPVRAARGVQPREQSARDFDDA